MQKMFLNWSLTYDDDNPIYVFEYESRFIFFSLLVFDYTNRIIVLRSL